MKETIERFVGDLRLDLHSLVPTVRRSDAGSELRSKPKEALPFVIAYLKALPIVDKDSLEQNNVQVGLVMLLSDLGAKLGAVIPQGFRYGEREEWIKWAEAIIVHPTGPDAALNARASGHSHADDV